MGKLYIFDNGFGKGEEFLFQEISKEEKLKKSPRKKVRREETKKEEIVEVKFEETSILFPRS